MKESESASQASAASAASAGENSIKEGYNIAHIAKARVEIYMYFDKACYQSPSVSVQRGYWVTGFSGAEYFLTRVSPAGYAPVNKSVL